MPATRREQRRSATLAEIKAAALRQLRAVGAADLSLRAVAAELEMSPGGLYRYYDGRDGLLTALITDGFADLAAAVTAARDAVPEADLVDRLLAAAQEYRRWAVAHPHDFALLYGTPIPGYAAPADGPTSAASRSVGAAFVPLFVEAWRSGRLRPPDGSVSDAEVQALVRTYATAIDPDLPPAVATTILVSWSRLHGPVVLEVFGHLRWLSDDAGALFTAAVTSLLEDIGLLAADAQPSAT